MLVRAPETHEWVEVERVVDADTLHVRRGAEGEKLRLCCVDAEEKLAPGEGLDPHKPQTVFGEESALWARELFAQLSPGAGQMRAGLHFPGGREERDRYGRLLAHVALPDGRDFNLLLVRLGRSPYFDKYGNSPELHAQFERAEELARAEGLGIWNAATNDPATPGAPCARRDYQRLGRWWRARALAVEAFRAARERDPAGVVAAEDASGLDRARSSGRRVAVFGAPLAVAEQADGALELTFASSQPGRELRVGIPGAQRATLAALELERRVEPWRQNYLWVEGRLRRREQDWRLALEAAEDVRPAGPEPVEAGR